MRDRIEELKNRCVEGTIDAAIAGGNLPFTNHSEANIDRQEYVDSINFIAEQVLESLGFRPLVATGPKVTNTGADWLFYDSESRKLSVIRPNKERGKKSNASYDPKDIDQHLKAWEAEATEHQSVSSR